MVGLIHNFGQILLNPRAQVRLAPNVVGMPGAAAGSFAALTAASMAAAPQPFGPQPTLGGNPVPGKSAANLSTRGGFVAADFAHYLGHSTGTGQCVALVQAASPGIGPTRNWVCGAPVRGNTSLRPGTAIATFDHNERYANATDGSSHAAIYLGQDERGIQVMDQWSGSAGAVRTIPWSNPSGVPANTGNAFHVVRSA